MVVILIDASADSLTISWPPVENATRYVLQWRKNKKNDDDDDEDPGSQQPKPPVYETLTDQLTTTQARKKNLQDPGGRGFYFRVGALFSKDADAAPPTSWMTQNHPFYLLSKEEEDRRMEAPTASLAGAHETLLITWKPVIAAAAPSATDALTHTTYELQMREYRGGADWITLSSSLVGTQVRKKNLSFPQGYQFRVRPVGGDATAAAAAATENDPVVVTVPFSPPSDPVVALGLSAGIKRLFQRLTNATLLRSNNNNDPIPLTEALGGKEFVLLYASASWCGPCRQFTPRLVQWYQSLGANNKTVEIVFVSADHDVNSFRTYFNGHMPWLAVDYDTDETCREELMSYIKVKGIPQLAVLDGRTGTIVELNAVGKPLDVNQWRRQQQQTTTTTKK